MKIKDPKIDEINDMPEHEHHGESPEVGMEWEKMADKRLKFANHEALEYIGKEAFIPHEECVCCIDERVASRETLGGKEVGGRWFIAGSGILLPVESWQERAKVAAAEAFQRGIKQFSYHAGCGAAKLAAEKDGADDPSLHAENFVRLAQKELNILRGKSEDVIFVEKSEVVPHDFHVALGAVVDITSKFNPHTLKDGEPLKDCFMLDWNSGSELSPNKEGVSYNLLELATAVGIALEHGFGQHFDANNKFNIVIMSFDGDELNTALKKIQEFIDTQLLNKKDLIDVIPHLAPASDQKKD